jgi:hypothetical protein
VHRSALFGNSGSIFVWRVYRQPSIYDSSTPFSTNHEISVVAKVRDTDPDLSLTNGFNSISVSSSIFEGLKLTTEPLRMSSTKKPTGKTQRSAIADVVAREYTIHLHKRVIRTSPAKVRIGR